MKIRDYTSALQNRDGSSDIDCQVADDGMTEQSHKADSDINTIVRRIERGQPLSAFQQGSQGIYGDFTQFQDYQENLNTVIAAQEAFDSLPAPIRKRFDNDPVELMKFLDDNKNREEAENLGLVNKKPEPVPAPPPQQPSGGKNA